MESINEFVTTYHIPLLVISWLFSFGIGFIIVHIWKKGMNTVRSQTHACDYVIPGSLNFHERKDRFLYSTVRKTRRTQSSSTASTARRR
ncbi:MAG: hypothetical protein FWD14_08315 [Treponema sp.]|nr:hypothetical protein [Treponema sp.]